MKIMNNVSNHTPGNKDWAPAHQDFTGGEENSETEIPEAAKLIEILQEKQFPSTWTAVNQGDLQRRLNKDMVEGKRSSR